MRYECIKLAIDRELGRLPYRTSATPPFATVRPPASEFDGGRVEAEAELFDRFVAAADAANDAGRRLALLEKLDSKLDASAAELVALAEDLGARVGI